MFLRHLQAPALKIFISFPVFTMKIVYSLHIFSLSWPSLAASLLVSLVWLITNWLLHKLKVGTFRKLIGYIIFISFYSKKLIKSPLSTSFSKKSAFKIYYFFFWPKMVTRCKLHKVYWPPRKELNINLLNKIQNIKRISQPIFFKVCRLYHIKIHLKCLNILTLV